MLPLLMLQRFPAAAMMATLCISPAVLHGAAPASPKITEPVAAITLDRMVVTGTHLRLEGDAHSAPVTTLDRTDIEQTGLATNLLEVLQKRLPMFSGSGNLGTTNANSGASATAGGSQLALRNLSTLVLVNGRRVSDNGIAGKGGRSFVDVSQIPVSAIERIEVLADGASAIYGSDAIGGVVNVVLRRDYRGLETGARHAFSSADGGYTERSAHATGGAGNERASITLSAHWSKTDSLLQSERGYSSPLLGQNAVVAGAIGQGNAFPTHLLNPALGSPRERNSTGPAATATSLATLVANGTYQPAGFDDVARTFDLAPHVTLILGRESRSGYASGEVQLLGRQLELFGDALVTRNDTTSQVVASSTVTNLTVPVGSPFNPLTTDFPQVAFRYLPRPRVLENESRLVRSSLGVRGELGSRWRWQAAYTRSRTHTAQRVRNVLYGPNLTRAVAGGYDAQGVPTAGGVYSRVLSGVSESVGTFVIQPALDPFARPAAVDPASLQHLFGRVVGDYSAGLSQLDATIAGEGWLLPAGNISVALGGDFRRETVSGQPDENSRNTGPTARRWLGAPYFDPFNGGRRIVSAFGEVRIPLAGPRATWRGAHALDFDLAYRVDNYDDAGRARGPKVGVRWQPVSPGFSLRASLSESFQAPPLHALAGGVTQVFTPAAAIPAVFGVAGQALQQTGSNPALRPSTAKTRSFGLRWSPRAAAGVSLGADFIAVDQVDIAGLLGAAAILQDVDARGPASAFAGQVAFFNFPGAPGAVPVTAAGQLHDWLVVRRNSAASLYVVDTQRNIAGQHVQALDLHLGYRAPTGRLGAWDLRTSGTFFLNHQFQATPLERHYQYAGHATRGGTASQGTLPGYRFYSTADWRHSAWGATLGHTYVASVVDIATGGLTFENAAAAGIRTRRSVDAFSAFDFALRHTWKKPASRALSWLAGTTLTLGVNNLADRAPPLAPQAFDDNNADISTYDPIGRLWHASLRVKF